jgi:hypothetical protein
MWRRRFALTIFFVSGFCCLPHGSTEAQQSVKLVLSNQRSIVGIVDQATNESHLALRSSSDRIALTSSFPWSQIRSIQTESQTLTGQAAQQWAMQNRSQGLSFAELARTSPASTESKAEKVDAMAIKPTSISITGVLANWDRDAAPEGIEVALVPIDATGLPAPVRGRLELKLIIEQDPLIDIGGVSHQPVYREIAKKSFSVDLKNFVNGVAIFRLPIRDLPTDLPNDVACTGLVHARFSVPGYRVLNASDSQVMLRDMTRFREQKRLFSQERFFPFESR